MNSLDFTNRMAKRENRKPTMPPPSSEAAHNRMKSVRRSGTAAELALRDALEALGVSEYEVDARPLPDLRRRADILFREEKVAVFVDGCFWHGCPIHGTSAKANASFWAAKIRKNKERDEDTNRRLSAAGWLVIRIWEHEDPAEAAKSIKQMLEEKRSSA